MVCNRPFHMKWLLVPVVAFVKGHPKHGVGRVLFIHLSRLLSYGLVSWTLPTL